MRGLGVAGAALPGLLLAWSAVAHLRDGLAWDAAIPVPNGMIEQIPLERAEYQRAADALSRADPADGDAQIAAAEARMHLRPSAGMQIAGLREGLEDNPASARGWTLLSEALFATDRPHAASALAQALILDPDDFWLAGARARDAAVLWYDLDDDDARAAALRQTRLLWEEPQLRGQLHILLSTRAGVRLVQDAFATDVDELRALNRWVSAERRRRAAGR